MSFVDPDARLKERLQIESARVFSVDGDPRAYLRIRVGSRDGLEGARLFVAEDASEQVAVALEGHPRVPCFERSTCLEVVTGPGVVPDDAGRVILEFPRLGHRVEAPLLQERLPSYAVDAEPLEENTRLLVRIERDPIADRLAGEARVDGRAPFARAFDITLAPGACGAAPETGWRAVQLPAELDVGFDQAGLVCVGLRPSRPAEGPVVATRTISARAIARSFRHIYIPPRVPAPMAWLTLFDLEIPSPGRCRMTQDSLERAIGQVARDIAEDDRRGIPVLGLSPVQIAEIDGQPCRQSDTRSFDPVEVARRAASELRSALGPDARVRLLLLYATNLALRAPPSVQASLTRLSEALLTEGVEASYLVAVGPEIAVTGLGAEGRLPWISTLEPAFEDALFGVLAAAWPFQSLSHGASTVVPLADAEQIAGLEAFRLCATSRRVEPVGASIGGAGAIRPVAGGPAYTVSLDPIRLAPSSAFQPPTVEVRWEGCYALCDRPGPGRGVETSWLEEDTCLP